MSGHTAQNRKTENGRGSLPAPSVVALLALMLAGCIDERPAERVCIRKGGVLIYTNVIGQMNKQVVCIKTIFVGDAKQSSTTDAPATPG